MYVNYITFDVHNDCLPLQETASSYYPILQLSSAHEHSLVYPPTCIVYESNYVCHIHVEL